MAFIPSTLASPLELAPTRVFCAIAKQGLLMRPSSPLPDRTEEGRRAGMTLPTEEDLRSLGIELEHAVHMGALESSSAYAVAVPDAIARALAPPFEILGIRSLVDAVSREVFELAGHATHLLDWWSSNRFCGRCGAGMHRLPHERCMKCPNCSFTAYPRIAPAIITLIRRGDEALLARNGRFPIPFYSTLAGFAEIGESLEQTLAREVFEEVGIRVKNVRYFGSQPWPFPNSLMVGFTADWESGEITVDGEEIADARWFRADQLPQIPPKISIARQLIDAWLADVPPR